VLGHGRSIPASKLTGSPAGVCLAGPRPSDLLASSYAGCEAHSACVLREGRLDPIVAHLKAMIVAAPSGGTASRSSRTRATAHPADLVPQRALWRAKGSSTFPARAPSSAFCCRGRHRALVLAGIARG